MKQKQKNKYKRFMSFTFHFFTNPVITLWIIYKVHCLRIPPILRHVSLACSLLWLNRSPSQRNPYLDATHTLVSKRNRNRKYIIRVKVESKKVWILFFIFTLLESLIYSPRKIWEELHILPYSLKEVFKIPRSPERIISPKLNTDGT